MNPISWMVVASKVMLDSADYRPRRYRNYIFVLSFSSTPRIQRAIFELLDQHGSELCCSLCGRQKDSPDSTNICTRKSTPRLGPRPTCRQRDGVWYGSKKFELSIDRRERAWSSSWFPGIIWLEHVGTSEYRGKEEDEEEEIGRTKRNKAHAILHSP